MSGTTLCLAIVVAIATLAVLAAVLFLLFPYRGMQAVVALLRRTCFSVRLTGRENIPATGPALFASNHVSLLDSLILLGITGLWGRRIRFMMHENFFRKGFPKFLNRLGVIRVPAANHPKDMRECVRRTRELLAAGELVCMFPEGGVSGNGLTQRFKSGFREMLPPDVEVPIIPIRIGLLWGPMFALHRGRLRFTKPRQFPIPIHISVGKPVSKDMTPFQLRQRISEMGAEAEMEGFPQERTLHESFARNARRRPFRATFKDAGEKGAPNFVTLVKALTLSRMIRELDEAGSPGGRIGVFLPNCASAAAVLLGILYADRIPAILNFSAGRAACQEAIRKANLKIVLTSGGFLRKLNMEPLPVMIMLEDVLPKLFRPAMKRNAVLAALLLPARLLTRLYAPARGRDAKGEAVLLFSSGSSGKPKGVRLSHHNVNSNFFSYIRNINWTPRDAVLGNLPLFHAFGFMLGFVLPCMSGTPVTYVANPLDAAAACDAVERDRCTLLVATPTFLQTYLRKLKPGQFDSLRLLITGAEKLRKDIAETTRKATGLTVVEGYGCTELSPIVAINLSHSVFDLGRECGHPGSVGAPMPGIHVKIVDPDTREELPENTPGLMLVKGGSVMMGYLDDPEATAAAIDQDGFYNTGDIASLSEDGYLTITGRLSRFSKIAGEMVPHELVEMAINEELQSEDRVVAVVGAHDPKRGERLVVFHATDRLDAADMIERLRRRGLPNLWTPKAQDFLRIDRIPLLGSGKIDVQTLSRLAEERTLKGTN